MKCASKSLLLVICLTVFVSSFTMISFSKGTMTAGSGTAYYVSTTGDDSNNGTSDTSPFRTINFAGKKLQAGDTLYIMGGTYIQDQLTLTTSGTIDNPITVQAYEAQTPIIDMQNSVTYNGSGIFFNDYTSNIIIDGITVNNTRGGAYAIDLLTWPIVDDVFHTNITIINSSISNCNYGIAMFGCQDVKITNNHFDNCGGNLTYIEGVQDGQGSGDFITLYYCQRVLIENNYFTKAGHYIMYTSAFIVDGKLLASYDNVIRNNVMDQYWGGGMGIICGAHDTLVENNLITNCGIALINYGKSGIVIYGDNNIVRNNLFAKSAANKGENQDKPGDSGITLQSYNFKNFSQSCVNNRVYNNNIYKNGSVGIIVSQRDSVLVADNKVFNNIMYKNRVGGPEIMNWLKVPLKTEPMWFNIQVEAMTTQGTAAWKTDANRNLFYNNVFMPYANGGNAPGYNRFMWIGLKTTDAFYSVEGLNAKFPANFFSNLEVDPMFINEDDVDFTKNNFNLKEESPCVDAGAHLAKTTEAGVNTTQVKVDDSLYFCDGYGMVDGDTIKIGVNNPVRITNVDHINNVLTITDPISYGSGDYVDLPYNGNAPDMGMYESPYSSESTPTPVSTTMPVVTGTPTATPTKELTLTPSVSPTPTPAFIDLDGFDWAVSYINSLASSGVVEGYLDGTFKPGNNITRAEFIKMLTLAYKEFDKIDETAASTFTDVATGQWYYKYVASAQEAGLVIGNGDGTFSPDAEMTREEMFAINARAMNKYLEKEILGNEDAETVSLLSEFVDGTLVSDWARGFTATNVKYFVVTGSPIAGNNTSISPKKAITRAEVAAILSRAQIIE